MTILLCIMSRVYTTLVNYRFLENVKIKVGSSGR